MSLTSAQRHDIEKRIRHLYNINSQDDMTLSPLALSINNSHNQLSQILIEGGAHKRDGFGTFKTALNCAAHMGNSEMVDYLLPRINKDTKENQDGIANYSDSEEDESIKDRE